MKATPELDLGSLAWVALGGALGAGVRGLVLLIEGSIGPGSEWGEALITVNLVGTVVLGALAGFLECAVEHGSVSPARSRAWRLGLGTGFCGGLTTMSGVAAASVGWHMAGRAAMAVGFAGFLVLGGWLAAQTGLALGRWAVGLARSRGKR